ncbi:MAG: PqqD family protein [Chlorobi bacterium]|nr:PqqD family protein [Chlorobiota bacterium]
MSLEKKYSKHPEVVSRKVDDEFILVPLNDDIADMDSIYTMNEVGAFIWEQINGDNTVKEIIETVTNEFDVKPEIAQKDVLTFFDDIKFFIK